MSKKFAIWLGVAAGLVGSVIIAVLAIAGYAIYQHAQVDHQNLHALTTIVQYNLQAGKILPVPPPAQTPAAPQESAPPVPPTEKKK